MLKLAKAIDPPSRRIIVTTILKHNKVDLYALADVDESGIYTAYPVKFHEKRFLVNTERVTEYGAGAGHKRGLDWRKKLRIFIETFFLKLVR